MNFTQSDEDLRQWSMLADQTLSLAASQARYAAAMYFYQQGRMSEETLEEFRDQAKNTSQPPAIRATQEMTLLLSEVERYIDRLSFTQSALVHTGFKRWKSNRPAPMQPAFKPACQNIATALQSCGASTLAKTIWRAAPLMRWMTYDAYPTEQIGEKFANGHAYATLMGEKTSIHADDFELGLFVIAPNTLYRDHRHKAPELYAPITGPHQWRFRPGGTFETRPAHEPVWNEPMAPHATLTGNVPFLCIYCWTGDVNEPAEVIHVDDWNGFE